MSREFEALKIAINEKRNKRKIATIKECLAAYEKILWRRLARDIFIFSLFAAIIVIAGLFAANAV